MAKMHEECDLVTEKVRSYKTKNAARMLESKNYQPGDPRKLNNFIFEQHDKLQLKKRSEDPQIPERAFEMTIDHTEFHKAMKRATQD